MALFCPCTRATAFLIKVFNVIEVPGPLLFMTVATGFWLQSGTDCPGKLWISFTGCNCVQCALRWPYLSKEVGQMTHCSPFQPDLLCDSVMNLNIGVHFRYDWVKISSLSPGYWLFTVVANQAVKGCKTVLLTDYSSKHFK